MNEQTTKNAELRFQRVKRLYTLELTLAFLVVLALFYYILVKIDPEIAVLFVLMFGIPLTTFIAGPLWGFLLYFPTTFVLAIPVPGVPLTFNQLTGILMILGWSRWLFQGKARLVPTRYLALLCISLVYFSLSAVLGVDIQEGLVAIKSLLIFFILSLVIASSLNSRRDVMWLCWIILIVTFCHALIGFYEYFAGVDVLVTTRAKWMGTFRINAASPSAVVYGHFLLFAFPFGYYLFSESRNPTFRLVALLLSLFIIFVSILTLSRQVMIILALQVVLIPLLFRNRYSKIFLIIVIAFGVLSSPYIAHTIARRLETLKVQNLRRDRSVLARSDALKVGGRILKDKPLFGIGLGSFSTSWAEYSAFDTFMIHFGTMQRVYTDCTYNQLIAETGLIGLAFALSIYLGVIILTIRHRKKALTEQNRMLINFTSIVLVLIASLLIANIVEDTFLAFRSWLIYAFVLCLQKPWFLKIKEKAIES